MHQRDSHKDFINCVSNEEILTKGVVHCFTGSVSELYDYLDHDLYIGITGWLCDPKRGKDLEQVIPKIPLEKLMIETDSPYLSPHPFRGTRNESKNIKVIAEKLSEIYKCDVQKIAKQTTENTINLFKI